jgi:hypothetical protein
MLRDEHQHSPASTARACRVWLGYVYALATILAVTLLGVFVAGIITRRGSLIFVGLFMCISFALFWRDVGSLICRDLRRRRDRALTRDTKT